MSAAPNSKAGRPTTPSSQSKEMQEYLLKYMPDLTEALTEMSIKRPRDAYAYLAQHLLSLSEYPDKENTSRQILAFARDPNQQEDESETVVGGAGKTTNSKKPLHIVIAGAPCSGKGTQCEVLKERFDVVHISTGDLLRAEVKKGSELGKKASGFMSAGKLIPDDLITDVVKEKLRSDECKKRGWMLDGFPRTSAQAKALEADGFHADIFLQLNVPDEVLIKRVTNRRTDPETGKTYDVQFNPPPAAVAARCVQRPDDTEEKVKVRLEAYHDAIDAIQAQYKKVTFEIDGAQKKEVISQKLIQAVEKAAQQKK